MTTSSTEILKIMELIRNGKEPKNKDFIYEQYKLFFELGNGDFDKGAQIYFNKKEAVFRQNKLDTNPYRWIFRDVLFRGTPLQFVYFVERLETRKFRGADDHSTFMLHFEILDYDEDKAHISLRPSPRGFANSERPSASIYALAHPDGFSKITLECYPDDWAGIEKYWNEFIDILKKESLEKHPIIQANEQEEMYLSCNRDKFENWLHHQYPQMLKYRDRPFGGEFEFGVNRFQFDYQLVNERHKYTFIWLDGFTKIRDEFLETVRNRFGISEAQVGTAKPEKPQAPKRGSSMVVWFDYYHEMKRANYKISFTNLASLSGYSANTFKQEHGRYKSERGID